MSTTGASKYTVPTGDGYCGVWQANDYSIPVCIGTLQVVDWGPDTTVSAVDRDTGVLLVEGEHPDAIAEVGIRVSDTAVIAAVPAKVARYIEGMEPNADVRAYDREGGLLLVASAADPTLGGHDA